MTTVEGGDGWIYWKRRRWMNENWRRRRWVNEYWRRRRWVNENWRRVDK